MLPPLNVPLLPSESLAQRCTHACAAFQYACTASQTRLCSVPKRLFSVAHTLVQRCKPACTALRIACSALQALVQRPSSSPLAYWGVGGMGGIALNPGAGHWRPARVLAGGLRLVTEGYSGVPPLPPTSSGWPPTHLRPTRTPVNYGVFCAWC